jgi:hypothetical protein
MKRFFKKFNKREKESTEPPQQPDSSGTPPYAVAGPPSKTGPDRILTGRQPLSSESGGKIDSLI